MCDTQSEFNNDFDFDFVFFFTIFGFLWCAHDVMTYDFTTTSVTKQLICALWLCVCVCVFYIFVYFFNCANLISAFLDSHSFLWTLCIVVVHEKHWFICKEFESVTEIQKKVERRIKNSGLLESNQSFNVRNSNIYHMHFKLK